MATLVVVELEDEYDVVKTKKGWYFPIVEVKIVDKDGNVLEHGTLRNLRKAQMEEILDLNSRFRKKAWLKTVMHMVFNR